MASVIDERNLIVQQNIPKLVKSLTNFSTTSETENFKICINYAYSHFKYHRFLSINSHEVKRDIDGICEKLRFSNFHDTEKKFRKMVEECITHDLAVNHYEKDVMFSVLNLLTNLAYDPINNLKEKLLSGQEIITFKPIPARGPTLASDTFISSLLKDNFKLQRHDTDSDLSEWTDSEDEGVDEEQRELTDDKNETSPANFKIASSLSPPKRPVVIKTVKIENSAKWLLKNIQHSWWSEGITSVDITSSHPTANFCTLWQKHLCDKSLGFIKPRPLSLITEYCLLREIFWMFHNPVDCKFFKINENEIILQPNVTLPSTMPESLHNFLADILRSINLMWNLKSQCRKADQSSTVTHTMETYFNAIRKILDDIQEFILEEEATVKEQQVTYTVLILHNKLRPHAKMLEMLWSIHSNSTLSEDKFPPHVCATHLLASLNNHVKTSCSKEKKNLAIKLLISCLGTYLEIFEIWWTEARLDDLKQEFLMERVKENDFDMIQPRLLVKCKDKSFYLNDSVSKTIRKDSIIEAMLRYSKKAGFTMNIISKLDRIHEMRQIVNDSASLYVEFVKRIREEIKKFSQIKAVENEKIEPKQVDKKLQRNRKLVEDIKSGMLANDEHLLLLSFESTFNQLTKDNSKCQEAEEEDLYKVLNKATEFLLLPLERSIQQILNELLDKKISIAERFVMNIYLHEYQVDHHLQEIRKVFFIESHELTTFFCLKLFPQMDADESAWANPYLLTVALNDAINSRQQGSLMFSVEVGMGLHRSVLDSVDDIALYYNVNKSLEIVFTPQVMKKYNEVFRFLLKIKWGQQILNSLRFPDFFKHRAPYARMQMIDLVIKRLSLTRFAMLYSINSLHNHLMVMLQGLSFQLDAKVSKAGNISELISQHEAFVEAFYENSFLGTSSENVYGMIIETLKLAKVLRDEWSNVIAFASLDESGAVESISLLDLNKNTIEIEKAFGTCEFQLKCLLDF